MLQRLATRKNPQPFLDEAAFRALEAERKAIQTRTEELQAQRNAASKQIGQRKAKGESANDLMAQMTALKSGLDQSAKRLAAIQQQMEALLLAVPNLPHEREDVIGESQKLSYAGRPSSASPAVGYMSKHVAQLKQLVEDAMTL